MADKGIIFSAAMVRALLDGRKTQTRRLAKPRGSGPSLLSGEWSDSYVLDLGNAEWLARDIPYAVGDRLYVREAWTVRGQFTDVVEVGYRASERRGHSEYVKQWPVAQAVPGKAKPGRPAPKWPEWPKYGPSIHMPRWASRMWLAVTDVRVQRLQECSEGEAMAEGWPGDPGQLWPLDWYRDLWNSLHTTEGERWQDNPWVVAVTFGVHHGNIDAGGQDA